MSKISPFNALVDKVNYGNEYDKDAPFGGRPVSEKSIPDLKGKDDASSAYYVKLDLILTGRVPLAFAHAAHLLSAYKKLQNDYPNNEILVNYVDKLTIILELSIERNKRLMRKINESLAIINKSLVEDKRKTLHTVSEYNNQYISQLIRLSKESGIIPNAYLDETNDDYEVEGCTNVFCLEQLDEAGKASDAIRIIIDSNKVHWIILIVRVFAPGIGNLALAGGFLDSALESNSGAADREFEEEVSGFVWLKSQFSIKFDLPTQAIKEWDIRAKFAKHGMIVGANAIIYFLDQKNDNYLSNRRVFNQASKCCIIS
jgi:hypothetical protein